MPASAASASSPAPGGVPSPGDPREPARGPPWGERFVAWSALAVLAIAAVFFVQRIGEAPAGHGRDAAAAATTIAAPPAAREAARPSGAALAEAPSAATDARPAPAGAAGPQRARRAPPVAVSAVRKPARATDARAPSPGAPPAAAAEREPPAQPSRWELMREEIALCGADGFLSRMVCELEVRTRYCSGWWGSAAECPSGRTADYGN